MNSVVGGDARYTVWNYVYKERSYETPMHMTRVGAEIGLSELTST